MSAIIYAIELPGCSFCLCFIMTSWSTQVNNLAVPNTLENYNWISRPVMN
jgi:hypothetical protein